MLFNLFKKKKDIIQEDISSLNIDCFNIKIQLDHHNNLMVIADFNDKANIKAASEALYMLSSGQLLTYILESFLKNSDKYNKQLYLNKMLYECNQMNISNDNNNPIIRPSDVFVKKNAE